MTREEAINTIQELMTACVPNSNYYIVGEMAIKALKQEPQIRPKGHWINKSHKSGCGIVFAASECTCCGKKTPFNCDEFVYRYCPNCGADMESEEP